MLLLIVLRRSTIHYTLAVEWSDLLLLRQQQDYT